MPEKEYPKVKISSLKSPGYNPRQANEKQYNDLRKSIRKFGFVDPVIVNKRNNHIVGGNFRVKVAKELKMTEVPVVFVDLTDRQERELNLRLNKNLGDWDWEKLVNFEKELLNEVGFEDEELSKEFDLLVDDEEDDFDAKAEAEKIKKPESKLGNEVYKLGRHRLMCGDATKKEDVKKLMGGKKADMVFTDPPYGVDYEGKTKDKLKLENDKSVGVFKEAIENFIVKTGASFYVCCPAGNNFKFFIEAFEKVCYQSSTIIWAKNSMVMGHGDYHYQHEPMLYGWEKTGKHKFYGDRKQTTLWNVDRPTVSKEHPTQKPIALVEKAIKNSSKQGDIVLDLFGGSGSTLIACEQTKRICYMMEIDPKYCDVIKKRYKNFANDK